MKYIDEKRHPNFLEDISKTYSINIRTHQKMVVDTTVYQHLFDNKREKLSSSFAKNYLSGLKYSDWGINLKELYPQKKSRYMDYIIEGASENMLKAIFEQIVPEFSDKDKEYIIEKMTDKQQKLLNDYEKTDKEKDVYQKSLKKDKYFAYTEYLEDIGKKLDFPIFDNKIANQKKVINRLRKYQINISDDMKLSEVRIIGQGYDAEFELINVNSINIEKYKKWFRDNVAYLLNNNWVISKQTEFEKPDSTGIVVKNDINSKKNLTFSVSEEIEIK